MSRSKKSQRDADLVVVANRLPVDRVVNDDGSVAWRPSPGGLVTAIAPVMRENDGAWIGWSGGLDDHLDPFVEDGISLVPVPLSGGGGRGVLRGVLQRHPVAALPRRRGQARVPPRVVGRLRAGQPAFRREGGGGGRRRRDGVGARLPDAAGPGDAARAAARPADRLLPAHPLPARRAVLRSCRGAASSSRACSAPTWSASSGPAPAQNFVRLVRQRVGHKTHRDLVYLPDGRTVQAGSFPISIDTPGLDELARSESRRAARQGDPRAARQPLARCCSASTGSTTPRASSTGSARTASWSHEGRVAVEDAVFVQVATPSRERVEQYRLLRDEIDRLVGRLNGDLGRIGSPAIHYMHTSYPKEEMAALFRAADVMVVTPLRDGMNLVAKEYVACRCDNDRGAGALGVRRRRRRAPPGLHGQPLRRQRDEGRDHDRHARRPEGARPADAGDAQDGRRARREGLGAALPRRAARRPAGAPQAAPPRDRGLRMPGGAPPERPPGRPPRATCWPCWRRPSGTAAPRRCARTCSAVRRPARATRRPCSSSADRPARAVLDRRLVEGLLGARVGGPRPALRLVRRPSPPSSLDRVRDEHWRVAEMCLKVCVTRHGSRAATTRPPSPVHELPAGPRRGGPRARRRRRHRAPDRR